MSDALNDSDALYLRRAIQLSAEAGWRGNRPFGAVVVSRSGTLLGEGRNDNTETGNCTRHAEVNALSAASQAHPRDALVGATMYASGEPCVMCAGAIFWSGIRRVVFGIDAVSLRTFRALQAGADDLEMSCREVFATSSQPFEVLGPALADEALEPHNAFWHR
ncbi:nucleoside deaminase [Roseateles asaccharophilus]|uniref:tRNA(Arg) A34 adenosine deaminase TadA n=1 Tax=Roseateles asaccharophilus TaxID=582607 RepID=A0ABU2A8L9_9BURK|nr:nucleoside deaminase [Roseateles asaccharophilus]MDR7333526.1 tRNA(Arg) A34 adenosine deaminase TadA [Roseateles asaccharophilus]